MVRCDVHMYAGTLMLWADVDLNDKRQKPNQKLRNEGALVSEFTFALEESIC